MEVYSKTRSRRKLIMGCTSSEHSFAAELIANNSDLLTEILIRVPAKSLIRFNFRKPPCIVCNLTTKKFSVLPDIGPTSSELYRGNVCAFLAFDPSKSPHYKVLLFSYGYANNGRWVEIEIYSSQTSSWKHIYVPDPRGARFMFNMFWNGAIHCITYANVHARFEVEEEKLIQTPMPQNPKILFHDKIRYFGECGGNLLLIRTTQPCALGFSILQVHRDYCLWIMKYRVNLRPILSVLPKTARKTIITRCEFNVLCVVKGANEKDFTLMLAIRGKVISYNVKSKTLKVLHHLSTDGLDDWGGASWCNTYQFIESLSPV
ncbi:hypothetical protein ACSBR2_023121 [Camellia fascicularis]